MGKFGIVKRQEPITIDELKQRFPTKRNTITDETVEMLNEALSNPDFDSALFLDQLVDYQSVMQDTSASFQEYINAVKFCAYLETNCTITEAYKKARANDKFVQDRWNAPSNSAEYNELTNAASRYRKSKVVRQLLMQSDMPLYLMFQAERYKAVMVLAKEMTDAAYSKDRISAAKELLAAVKTPDNIQIELGVGLSKQAQDIQTQLFEQLAQISAVQHARLVSGEAITAVQRVGIKTDFVEAEVEQDD